MDEQDGREPVGGFPAFMLVLFFINLVVYPQWHLPGLSARAGILLGFLYVAASAGAYLFADRFARRLKNCPAEDIRHAAPPGKRLGKEEKIFLAAAGTAAFITHIPYLFLPLPALGDAHMHAGLPALAFARLDAVFNARFGTGLRPVWAGAVFIGVCAAVFSGRRVVDFFSSRRGAAITAGAGLVYVLAVTLYRPFEAMGELEHFFRYPLLGKLLFFSGYLTFGIHEWVGRLVQIAFLYAGAWYFAGILRIISTKTAAFCGFILFLVFPPFWNYAHQNYLESGVLFFSAASLYYLLSHLETGEKRALYLFAGFISVSMVYKEYLLALLPIAAGMAVIQKLRSGGGNHLRWDVLACSFVFPLVIAAQYYPTFRYLRSLYPYYPAPVEAGNLLDSGRMLLSMRNMVDNISPAAALASAAGLAAGAWKFRTGTLLLLWWLVVFWVMISATTGYEYPRTNLIYYMPVCGFLCFLPEIFRRKRECALVLFLLLAGLAVSVGPGENLTPAEARNRILPYGELFGFMKEEGIAGGRVYAPMICEPSHYYMAKHGIVSDGFIERGGWRNSHDSLEEFLAENGFEYIVIPEAGHVDEVFSVFMDPETKKDLVSGASGFADLFKKFSYGPNSLYLLKVRVSRNLSNK